MKTTANTVRYLGKCKGCKCAARVEAQVEVRRFVGDYGRSKVAVTVTIPNGATYRTDDSSRVFFKCLCGTSVEFRRVIGRVTAHKCGARCLASTSGVCECACGGKNHGASYAA